MTCRWVVVTTVEDRPGGGCTQEAHGTQVTVGLGWPR